MAQIPIPRKEALHDIYVIQGLSIQSTAEVFCVSKQTIFRWLKYYGITSRPVNGGRKRDAQPYQNREWMINEYIDKQKSLNAIAEMANVSQSTIVDWMRRLGIKSRSRSEASRVSVNWKGGKCIHTTGYTFVRVDGRYLAEHRIVASRTIGRELLPDEIVHHINGVKDDNRPENLRVLTRKEHSPTMQIQEKLEDARAEIARLRAILESSDEV